MPRAVWHIGPIWHGAWAWEIEVGPLVIQWFYPGGLHRGLHIWHNRMWFPAARGKHG